MFGDNVTRQLIAIENEQRAQKVAAKLNYGQLILPSSIPRKTWSGFVANATGDIAARFIATFTRADGINSPPLVDFPWDYSQTLGQYQDLINAGMLSSVSGRDKKATDEYNLSDGIYEIGQNYVSWFIEIGGASWYFSSASGSNVDLVVDAVSLVPGTLTLVRTI